VAEAVALAGCARQRRNERVTEIEKISNRTHVLPDRQQLARSAGKVLTLVKRFV
jgi:thiazole synthase ThiGH ThiG subunit